MSSKQIYEKERIVSSAFIDSNTKLGISQAFLLAQDNLTECFDMLECDGIRYLDFNVFWVFTKAKLKFLKRPDWRDKITVQTFPINNAGFRTNINTVFYKNEEKILFANQEACVLDKEKHRPVKLTTLPYPKENFPKAVYTEPFEKFEVQETDFVEIYSQKVRSQNIDMSNHMTNNEYIKFALNAFSTEFLKANEPDTIEVHYTGESKEGEILHILKAEQGKSHFIKIKETDRLVFEMKITFF